MGCSLLASFDCLGLQPFEKKLWHLTRACNAKTPSILSLLPYNHAKEHAMC